MPAAESLVWVAAVTVVIWLGRLRVLPRARSSGAPPGGGAMSRRTVVDRRWVSVAIVGFVAFGAGAFKSNLTPYVSFEQARATTTPCRSRASSSTARTAFDEASSRLLFTLQDDSRRRPEGRLQGAETWQLQRGHPGGRHRPLPRRRARGREAAREVSVEVPGGRGEGVHAPAPRDDAARVTPRLNQGGICFCRV